jgi:hypothetical protein
MSASAPPGRRFWIAVGAAVLVRPWLWVVALRQFVATCPPGWWRHRPFVPRPDPEFLSFRFETAYGSHGVADVADFLRYLQWCRARRRGAAEESSVRAGGRR